MIQLQQLQAFQMNQQKNETPTKPTIPDSAQTPPTTEPDDSLSEVSEQKPGEESHDKSNDPAPNPDKTDQSNEISFDEAFEVEKQTLFEMGEDPFKPISEDTPTHDQKTLDAAFTPIAT